MAETEWRRAYVSSALVACLGLLGCEESEPKRPLPSSGSPMSGPLAAQKQSGASGERSAQLPKEATEAKTEGTGGAGSPPAPSYEIAEQHSFLLTGPDDVGPAAPMTASAEGVFFITKADGMFIARREGEGFVAISAERDAFYRYGRGPALTNQYAYWISASGRLARSRRSGGPTEYLTTARSGARVHSLETNPDSVVYLAEEDDHLRAMLWTEGREASRVSPDGADITSVGVIPGGAFPKLLMLEGRSGLSPLHARTVRFRQGRLDLAPDVVVWVGPGSQPLTEVHGSPAAGAGGIALIATAKDIVTFGVAILTLDSALQSAGEPVWITYPNGIDPAPISLARACGDTLVFYAVPSEARPHAPQELRVARLRSSGFESSEILARARAFNEISVAPLKKDDALGVVLAFTADHRTWASVLRCKREAQKATK